MSYPGRNHMKIAHKVAEDASVVFDFHTMTEDGHIIFFKCKKTVARYNVKTGKLRRRK